MVLWSMLIGKVCAKRVMNHFIKYRLWSMSFMSLASSGSKKLSSLVIKIDEYLKSKWPVSESTK